MSDVTSVDADAAPSDAQGDASDAQGDAQGDAGDASARADGGTSCGGSCVDTQTDVRHCGACGAACAPANATGSCTAGACGVASCNPGFANCDGVASNGCEVNLANSSANCGTRGRACGVGMTCRFGRCG